MQRQIDSELVDFRVQHDDTGKEGGEVGGGWNDRSTRLFIKRGAETSEELTIRMRNHLYPTLI